MAFQNLKGTCRKDGKKFLKEPGVDLEQSGVMEGVPAHGNV